MAKRRIVNWEQVVTDVKQEDLSRLVHVLPEFSKKNIRGESWNRQFVFCCPFHKEKTPSLKFKQVGTFSKENFFYCFGCGESGSVIDYYMFRKNLSFHEAVRELARIYKIKFVWKNKKDINKTS